MEFICKYCGKVCKNKNSLAQHEIRCNQNPDKINTKIPGFNTIGCKAWNKGLTCETSLSLVKFKNSLHNYYKTHKGSRTGTTQSEETKQKISQARKKYIAEHPDQSPFKLNHSSHESFPEKYFRKWLIKNKLLEKQELQVSRYTLDFAWENKKAYLEIDGSQHHLDWMVEHDKERTKFLDNLGWTCIARVYWPDYQKLTKHQKHLYLVNLKQKILNIVSYNIM